MVILCISGLACIKFIYVTTNGKNLCWDSLFWYLLCLLGQTNDQDHGIIQLYVEKQGSKCFLGHDIVLPMTQNARKYWSLCYLHVFSKRPSMLPVLSQRVDHPLILRILPLALAWLRTSSRLNDEFIFLVSRFFRKLSCLKKKLS